LLHISRKAVRKWLRRAQQQAQRSDDSQPLLIDLPRAPHLSFAKTSSAFSFNNLG
jgi:hypothetical protein